MDAIATEIPFTLPIGYRDADGTLHRTGVMRLATAGDEILPLKDHRVQSNPGYLPVVVLSRVVAKLGSVDMITTQVVEDLFAADFNYLQGLYNQVNGVPDESPAPSYPLNITEDPSGKMYALPGSQTSSIKR